MLDNAAAQTGVAAAQTRDAAAQTGDAADSGYPDNTHM